MRLEDAIDFRGTCQTMCPEFERVEREVQNMLDPLEMVVIPFYARFFLVCVMCNILSLPLT